MLDRLIFVVTQKLALLFVIAGLAGIGGFLTMGTATNVPSSQTAIISNAAISPSSTAPIAIDLPGIPASLLPTTTIPFCPASSTCGEKGLRALVRPLGAASKKTAAKPIKIIPQAPVLSITAQSFLNNTTSSFKILFNGLDELVFTTNLGGNQNALTWGLLTTTIGGTGSTPAFSVASSCTPVPNQPDPGAPDQNPSFNVRTAYDCAVSLTPQSDADRRTQTKDFSSTTPPGRFVVLSDTAMDTVLVNNTNNGGVIFNNQDSNPITVTSVTFNASYAYLATTLDIPLVLRFQDPSTGRSLVDYALTNASDTNVTVPLSFIVAPLSQKLFPIQVLGVQKMLIQNTTPSVNVTITSVTIDRNDVKIVLHNPSLAWSCNVSQTGYDPNATSGAYATGAACLQ